MADVDPPNPDALGNIGTFKEEIVHIIQYDLAPLYHMMEKSLWVIGIVLILVGIYRLKLSYSQQTHRHHSPLATVFYFVTGVIFVGFGPEILMVSQSTFGDTAAQAFTAPEYKDNPVMYYVNTVGNEGEDFSALTMELVYSILLVVGVFAFARGFLLMIKLGEGGHEATLPKAVTHILAGVVGINFEVIYNMLHAFV